jgi:hypothetical protein
MHHGPIVVHQFNWGIQRVASFISPNSEERMNFLVLFCIRPSSNNVGCPQVQDGEANIFAVKAHVNRGYLQKDTKLPAFCLMPAPLAWWSALLCHILLSGAVAPPWHRTHLPESVAPISFPGIPTHVSLSEPGADDNFA